MSCSLLILNLILTIAISFAGWSKSNRKSNGKDGYNKATPAPVTPSPTTLSPTSPTNSQLCGCFDIDIMCDPIEKDNEICYFYRVNRISDDDYCLDAIDYIAIDTGDNLDQCGLDSTPISDIVTDYSPKCNTLDTDYSSSNVNGIKIKIADYNDGKSSGSGSKSKGGDDDRRRLRRRLGGSNSKKSSKSKKGSSYKKGSDDKGSYSGGSGGSSNGNNDDSTDYVIFSLCFDTNYVGGTQDNGKVEFGLGDCKDTQIFTCDVPDILPEFCGSETTTTTRIPVEETVPPITTTAAPVTPSPVTPAPVTPAPTTPEPTTPAPTTPVPTTPAPVTPEPTTPEPTTPAPTTPAPTTPAPTTPAPTTPEPTTPEPTTPAPTTPEPTTPAPTTPEPTTPAPTTPEPTTPAPTTPLPTTPEPTTPAPTTPEPTTPAPTTPAPTTPEPTTPEPTTPAPTTPAPTTAEPTPRPTTPQPTTANPTSATPTTADPTTANPTSSSPTTSDPTTATPTTAEPTTSDPTTAAPTTSEPTTSEPTTSGPTTSNPTTAQPSGNPTQDPTTTLQPTESPVTSQPTTAEPTPRPTSDPTQPSNAPTLAPTFEVCSTEDAVDVTFLLDESGSVSSEEWDAIVSFVDRLIQFDISDDSYVSIFEYAALPGFQEILDFTNVGADRDLPGDVLEAAPYSVSGVTETWDAVNRVLDNFYEYNSNCLNFSHPNPAYATSCQRSDFLILITDGAPTGNPVCPDMIDRMQNDYPVDVILILIDTNSTFNISEVDCLDIVDNKQDVIKITDFSEAGLIPTELQIREKLCNGELGPTEGDPYEDGPWIYEDGSSGLGPVPTRSGNGGGGGNDRAEVGEEIQHDTEHQIAETTSNEALMWEIPVIIGAAVILLLGIAGSIYYCKYKKNKVESGKDVKQMTQLNVGNSNKKDGVIYGTARVIEEDVVCDSVPVSPDLDVTSPDCEEMYSPDCVNSPDALKVQDEINSIYADINV